MNTLQTAARIKAPKFLVEQRSHFAMELRWAFDDGMVPSHENHDYNLQTLTEQIGSLARTLHSPNHITPRLRAVAGFTMHWAVMEMPVSSFDFAWSLVLEERARQRSLFATGKLSFNVASDIVDPRRKLRVLVEELGEVAEAVDFLEVKRPTLADAALNLQKELIQVAAVAVAWLEALEAQRA